MAELSRQGSCHGRFNSHRKPECQAVNHRKEIRPAKGRAEKRHLAVRIERCMVNRCPRSSCGPCPDPFPLALSQQAQDQRKRVRTIKIRSGHVLEQP